MHGFSHFLSFHKYTEVIKKYRIQDFASVYFAKKSDDSLLPVHHHIAVFLTSADSGQVLFCTAASSWLPFGLSHNFLDPASAQGIGGQNGGYHKTMVAYASGSHIALQQNYIW